MSRMPDQTAPLAVPDHELLRVIGKGSYGEVWQARNVMGTPRAVKVVKRHDFDYSRPFDREFEGIQRFEPVSRTHEGLVQVLHVGMGRNGDYFYYVMELADDAAGQDIDSPVYRPRTLRDEISRTGELPVEDCIEAGMILASALGHLHKHGLVHRDVKPANIIYVNGRPKLADVGLVALMSDTRSIVGTEGFVAPEGTGQPRSDVFSLGRVLYECLTGKDRLSFPDVPESWTTEPEGKVRFEMLEIVLRAGDPDAKRRYADTTEMLADLALLRAGKSLRHMRRVETRLRRALQVLAFSTIGVAVAAGAWALERSRRQRIETLEHQTRNAREETQSLLSESLVAQARSVRKSGLAGARIESVSAALRARTAGAPVEQVRTQVASALGLFDVGEFSEPWPADRSAVSRTVASDDGLYMATGFDEGKCRIFRRTDSGPKLITTIEDKNVDRARELAISRGGQWLAAKAWDGRLLIYDALEGNCMGGISAAEEPGMPQFSADASWMVLWVTEGLIAMDCTTGKRVLLAPGAGRVRRLCLSPDGTWIATLPAEEKGFRLYTGLPGRMPDFAEASALKIRNIESDIELNGSAISGDSRYLSAAVSEDRLRIWEVPRAGPPTQIAWLRGHQRTVRGTTFHPHDSSIIASASYDGTVRLWDIPTRQQILVAPAGGDEVIFAPGRNEILVRNWAGDSLRSAAFCGERGMRVLMLPSGSPNGLFTGVAFSPDGRLLAASGDAGILIWVLQTGQIEIVRPAQPYVWRGVSFGPDGKTIWTTSGYGLHRHSLDFDDEGTLKAGPAQEVHQGRYRDMTWSGDRLVVSHGPPPAEGVIDGRVSFISPDGTTDTVKVPHFSDTIAVSPDGRWLACSNYPYPFGSLIDLKSADRAAVRIDAPSRCTFFFPPHHPVIGIGSDRDVRFQLLPGAAGTVPPEQTRSSSEFIPARFTLSPDGSLLAVSTGSTEIGLFDAATMTRLATLDSALTPFDCVLTFSPDGTKLALAGGVSRVVIWDIAWLRKELTGRQLGW